MSELGPYTFDLDNPSKDDDDLVMLRRNVLSLADFAYKGQIYRFASIKRQAFEAVPDFVGMPGGNNLYASAAINPQFIPHVLGHEIECNRLRVGEVGRCCAIEEELLGNLNPAFRRRHIEVRFEMFRALCAHYEFDPDNPPKDDELRREIAGTYQFLRVKNDQS